MPRSVIVKRFDENAEKSLSEIKKLARSYGYTICEVITQERQEDSEYNIGEGKLHDVSISVSENDVDTVIIDNELGPYQRYNIGIYLPSDISVIDRYDLILDIFDSQADTKIAQLQVELARLRRELPHIETKNRLSHRDEKPGFMGLGEYDKLSEKSVKKRIKRIKQELDKRRKQQKNRVEQRKEEGFDIVSIVGYTNAGKSTLFRRLAEHMSVEEYENIHDDLSTTAESSTDYFQTLDTTTRKLKTDKRDILLTDTVGFISDMHPSILNTFYTSIETVKQSDLVIVTVDSSENINTIVRKVTTSYDIVSHNATKHIITVFTKTDKISDKELQRKKDYLKTICPNSIGVSAKNNTNIDRLQSKIQSELPEREKNTIVLSQNVENMSLVSWIHENAYVMNCNYTADNIIIEFKAKKPIVRKIKSKLSKE